SGEGALILFRVIHKLKTPRPRVTDGCSMAARWLLGGGLLVPSSETSDEDSYCLAGERKLKDCTGRGREGSIRAMTTRSESALPSLYNSSSRKSDSGVIEILGSKWRRWRGRFLTRNRHCLMIGSNNGRRRDKGDFVV